MYTTIKTEALKTKNNHSETNVFFFRFMSGRAAPRLPYIIWLDISTKYQKERKFNNGNYDKMTKTNEAVYICIVYKH